MKKSAWRKMSVISPSPRRLNQAEESLMHALLSGDKSTKWLVAYARARASRLRVAAGLLVEDGLIQGMIPGAAYEDQVWHRVEA